MAISTQQADKAIKSGVPLRVRGSDDEEFDFLIESRDLRRAVGKYLWKGLWRDGAFDLAYLDVNPVEYPGPRRRSAKRAT